MCADFQMVMTGAGFLKRVFPEQRLSKVVLDFSPNKPADSASLEPGKRAEALDYFASVQKSIAGGPMRSELDDACWMLSVFEVCPLASLPLQSSAHVDVCLRLFACGDHPFVPVPGVGCPTSF